MFIVTEYAALRDMRTTAYLKAIMELYEKSVTGHGPELQCLLRVKEDIS